MNTKLIFSISLIVLFPLSFSLRGEMSPIKSCVKPFEIKKDFLYLSRFPTGNYFDQIGRKFAILGEETGDIEAWGFPVKILRNLEISFILPDRVEPEPGYKFLKRFEATPETKITTFSSQYFTVKEIIIVPRNLPGAILLLDFSCVKPVTVILNFIPSLQPMWPAGIGGQYCFWDESLNAYIISESSRRFNAIIGSPFAGKISSPPAHQFSDRPYQLKIQLPEMARNKYFIPIAIVGGKYPREDVKKIYHELIDNPYKFYEENLNYYRDLMDNTLKIETPNHEINRAFSFAKLALDSLLIENHDLGSSLVAGFGKSGGSGRPGFGWFFGGDSFINSLSLLASGNFQPVKSSLEFFRKFQREDGKIPHEISQSAGIINWFGDYPFAFIHGDTTPYYILSFWEYVKRTGDISFLKESWESLKKAFNWCISTDENGDGLMDNKKAGLGALEFGQMINIRTDIYLGSIWVKALKSFSTMAEIIGDHESKRISEELFQKGLENLKNKFWDEEKSSYIYAIGERDEKVDAITPWPSLPIYFGLFDGEKALKTIERISSSEISTPWGCRILSMREKVYDPLNYNYGAVWPFITGFVSLSMYKIFQDLPAFYLLKGLAKNHLEFSYSSCHEVFSGENFLPLDESVPHQGFSSNALLLSLIDGLLGISVDSLKNYLYFEPKIPSDWDFVNVENIIMDKTRVSLFLKRGAGIISLRVKSTGKPFNLVLSIPLSFGAKVKGTKSNGKRIPFIIRKSYGKEVLEIRLHIKGETDLRIRLNEGVSFYLIERIPEIGEQDETLKITSIYSKGDKIRVNLEGISGKDYLIGVRNSGRIKRIEGAKLGNKGITVSLKGKEGVMSSFLDLQL